MVYPLPAVIVSCGDDPSNYNFLTISWTGTICSNPPMLSISVRPERHSYQLIKKTGEFVVNLTNKKLVFAADFSGVRSGREVNKAKKLSLSYEKGDRVSAPLIVEAPVNIECKVRDILKLGSHDMFIADVLCVHADKKYMDKKGLLDLEKADLISYSHGKYYSLGKYLGHFGFSVKKKKR